MAFSRRLAIVRKTASCLARANSGHRDAAGNRTFVARSWYARLRANLTCDRGGLGACGLTVIGSTLWRPFGKA
jgi:hypothetical protein